jgi:hypothetical protein
VIATQKSCSNETFITRVRILSLTNSVSYISNIANHINNGSLGTTTMLAQKVKPLFIPLEPPTDSLQSLHLHGINILGRLLSLL